MKPQNPSFPTVPATDERQPLELGLNERSEGAPAWAAQAVAELEPQMFWKYIDRQDLETKLARKFSLSARHVLVTNGGDEGILYLMGHLPAGAPVFLPLPTFGLYKEQADCFPVEPMEIAPLKDLSLDMASLTSAVETRPAGMAVVVRPNNPTGEMISRDAVFRLLHSCRKQGTLLLLDEAYAEFADDDMVPELGNHSNLVILRTFSKAYGLAGLRIGYLLGKMIPKLKTRALPYNVASASLFFAGRAVDNDWEMKGYVEKVRKNRDGLFTWLKGLGLDVWESQANYLLLRLGERKATFVVNCLRAQGILVRSFTRAELNGCIRISIPSDMKRLQEALRRALDPQLLCLDVDGCLVDVRESFDAVVDAMVRAYTGEVIDRSEILELRAAGGFNDDILLSRELILRRGRDIPLEELVPVFRGFYFGDQDRPGLNLRERALIRPELLKRLQRDYKIALVTGRNRQELKPVFPLLALPEDTICITLDDVQRGKPDPEGVLLAAEKTGTMRIWMLGDNMDDILAAQNAGAIPIGVTRENRAALEDAGAAIVLDEINEMEDLL